MAQLPHPDDRPDPNENMPAMRARVPEHLHRGVFSTGVIVMTGGTEFVLDFVQNLGRPHQIVARVVIPHVVMPQFADALGKNIDLYKQRFGPLPNPMIPGQTPIQNTPAEREPPSAAIQSESQIVGGFVDSDNPAPSGSQDIPRETASPVSKTPFASGMVPGSLASSGQGAGEAVPSRAHHKCLYRTSHPPIHLLRQLLHQPFRHLHRKSDQRLKRSTTILNFAMKCSAEAMPMLS